MEVAEWSSRWRWWWWFEMAWWVACASGCGVCERWDGCCESWRPYGTEVVCAVVVIAVRLEAVAVAWCV